MLQGGGYYERSAEDIYNEVCFSVCKPEPESHQRHGRTHHTKAPSGRGSLTLDTKGESKIHASGGSEDSHSSTESSSVTSAVALWDKTGYVNVTHLLDKSALAETEERITSDLGKQCK